MISDLFHCIQPVLGEEIGFSQLQSGLRPALIHINQEDWQRLTKGILRPGRQSLDEDAFHKMMRQQMRLFASRGLIELMGLTSSSSSHGDQGLPPLGTGARLPALASARSSHNKDKNAAGNALSNASGWEYATCSWRPQDM